MTVAVTTWADVLSAQRISKEHVDFALAFIDQAPRLEYTVISPAAKVYPPRAIAVSGVNAIIASVLATRHSDVVSYIITTDEVLNAHDGSPLYLANYAARRLAEKFNAELLTLHVGEYDKLKTLLSAGGIFVSGLPYELAIFISQLAGFGKIWHYSPTHRKFLVF